MLKYPTGHGIDMSYATKLLVCVTESAGDAALRYAARLAAATGARLTLAAVVEDVRRFIRPLLPRSWNVPELVRAEKKAQLERSAARARRLGVHPKLVLLQGAPVKAVVGEVRQGRHDLLVVGAGSAESIRSLGTSAARLVRECPCPVLLVHASRPRRRPQLLVAIDAGQLRPKSTQIINAKLLDVARWFAEQQAGDLHVLYVWDTYMERFLSRGGATEEEIEEFITHAREEARQDLERTIASVREHIASTRVHLERGDPRKVIAAFAADRRMDLLIIGTVARSGLAGRVIGNTAEAVLGKLPCSMLVVGPDRVPARAGRRKRRDSSHRRELVTTR
jgi:nucleotide-binding universal stress UspA family protein